jgi:hypothetical protein
MMVHWSSYLYKYLSWIDILAYCTDRCTDLTGATRGSKLVLGARRGTDGAGGDGMRALVCSDTDFAK